MSGNYVNQMSITPPGPLFGVEGGVKEATPPAPPPDSPRPLFGVVSVCQEGNPTSDPARLRPASFDLVLCGLGWLARNDNA